MANFTPFCKKILRFFTNNFQARPFLLLLSEMVHRNCHSKPHFFEHFVLHLELFELIKSNKTLWNMVKDDQISLKNIIAYVVKKNQDNIDNLTDDDKEGLVQEVLMEYLTVD